MRIDFCLVKNGSEVLYVNPSLVRYFGSHGSDKTRIVFDGAHSLDVKASPEDVEKMLIKK
jgi:hypothetical protein